MSVLCGFACDDCRAYIHSGQRAFDRESMWRLWAGPTLPETVAFLSEHEGHRIRFDNEDRLDLGGYFFADNEGEP